MQDITIVEDNHSHEGGRLQVRVETASGTGSWWAEVEAGTRIGVETGVETGAIVRTRAITKQDQSAQYAKEMAHFPTD